MFRANRWVAGILGLVLGGATIAQAAETRKLLKRGEYNPADAEVELFQAMKDGTLEVKLIPKDSTQAKVVIANTTKQPLNVKLPEAFAAVQVLAQIGGMGGGGMGGGGMQNQSMGGGMGGGGMGGMGGGGGGGMFNIADNLGIFNVPAEKTGEFDVACTCLEHGKGEPRSTMKYEIRPLESVTVKPGVREVCRLLGAGQLNQRVAQAAIWHLNNDMSWQELAAKQIKPLVGEPYPYFQPNEIAGAIALADHAVKVDEARQSKSPAATEAAPGRDDDKYRAR